MGNLNWKGLLSPSGDITELLPPEQLHQREKRTTADGPLCPGIKGNLDHMFLDYRAVKNIQYSTNS
jgi:hypothetical protein